MDIKFVHISTDHIFNKKYGKINENEKFSSKIFMQKQKLKLRKSFKIQK